MNQSEYKTKERLLVVCPGRGTYNAPELNYLNRYHSDKQEMLERFDGFRQQNNQRLISELDRAVKYDLKVHSAGDNASPLIYSCAWADFLSIDRERYDIAAVTGNSMGWYIALACSGVLSELATLELINTMGSLMQTALVGGQIVYPLVDENWLPIPNRKHQLMEQLASVNQQAGEEVAWVSIDLGGMLVLAGTDSACKQLMSLLPNLDDRFPLKIHNHAAFHTPLQKQVMEQGRAQLAQLPFNSPTIPLIDGRGHIWTNYSTDTDLLWDYTLGHQVIEAYDFTKAVQVAALEFGIDKIAVLGPGETLGGAVAQSLLSVGWQGWKDKASFQKSQSSESRMISMGRESQRGLLTV